MGWAVRVGFCVSVTGFDQTVLGKLLEQILILDTPMGIAYERAIGFEKESHVHGRHMLVCPRRACRMQVQVDAVEPKGRPRVFKVDSTQVLWVPQGLRHDDSSLSVIYDTVALFPSSEYFDQMITENGLTSDDRKRLMSEPVLLKRTRWLDDLIDRYFFERIVNSKTPPGCPYFLEKQILNELVRMVFKEKVANWETKSVDDRTIVLERALSVIEGDLFSKFSLSKLAEDLDVSPSTLLRSFKKDLGMAPSDYVQLRRLDEAMRLLQGGEHPVSDVALLVGYDDLSAFSRAFRKRFGKSPRELRAES